MTGTAASWGDAAEILRARGVPAAPEFYAAFTSAEAVAALTVPTRILAAVTAKDGDAFADVFAPDGSLVQYDDELPTREDIRAYINAAFAGPFKDCSVRGRPLSFQFLTDDVALLIEEAGVMLPGETEAAPERLFHASWIIVRRAEGEIELMSFQQSHIETGAS